MDGGRHSRRPPSPQRPLSSHETRQLVLPPSSILAAGQAAARPYPGSAFCRKQRQNVSRWSRASWCRGDDGVRRDTALSSRIAVGMCIRIYATGSMPRPAARKREFTECTVSKGAVIASVQRKGQDGSTGLGKPVSAAPSPSLVRSGDKPRKYTPETQPHRDGSLARHGQPGSAALSPCALMPCVHWQGRSRRWRAARLPGEQGTGEQYTQAADSGQEQRTQAP